MRRPKTAFTSAYAGAIVGAVLSLSLTAPVASAQQLFQAPAPPPPAPTNTSSTNFDPMASARNPSTLLRNGIDFIKYKDYTRALRFLREAERRQNELDPAERKALVLSINHANKMIQEGSVKPSPAALANARRDPATIQAGAMALASEETAPKGDAVQLTAAEAPRLKLDNIDKPATLPLPAPMPSASPAQERPASNEIELPAPTPARAPAAAPAPATAPAQSLTTTSIPLESTTDLPALPTAPAPASAPAPAAPAAPVELPPPSRPAAETEAPKPIGLEPLPEPTPVPPSTPSAAEPKPPTEPETRPVIGLEPLPEPKQTATPAPSPAQAPATPAVPAASPAPAPAPPATLPEPTGDPVAPAPLPEPGQAPAPLPEPNQAPLPAPGAAPDALPALPEPTPAPTAPATAPTPAPTTPAPVEAPAPAPTAPANAPPPVEVPVSAPTPAPAPAADPSDKPIAVSPIPAPGTESAPSQPAGAGQPTPPVAPAFEPPPAPEAEALNNARPAPAPVPAPAAAPVRETFTPDPTSAPATPATATPAPAPASEPALGGITLPPDIQEDVARIARRQLQDARPANPGQNPTGVMPEDVSGNVNLDTPTRFELPRPPSSTEARPLRRIPVPEDFVPMGEKRDWQPLRKYWAATATCHMPLYFQDANLERYGNSVETYFGSKGRFLTYPLDSPNQSKQRNQILQPFFSSGLFAFQVLALPYNLVVDPPWEAEYDLGYYRPGDRMPRGTVYLPFTGVGPPLHGKNY